jgi:hypothetical protein
MGAIAHQLGVKPPQAAQACEAGSEAWFEGKVATLFEKATQACEHKTWQFRDPKGWESECADCHITTDELDAAKASNDTREPK